MFSMTLPIGGSIAIMLAVDFFSTSTARWAWLYDFGSPTRTSLNCATRTLMDWKLKSTTFSLEFSAMTTKSSYLSRTPFRKDSDSVESRLARDSAHSLSWKQKSDFGKVGNS